MEAKLIPIEQFYLLSIAAWAESDKMECLLQDRENGKSGRLWLISATSDSSAPLAHITFCFEENGVTLAVAHRDERIIEPRLVKFAEGIDGFIADLARFFNAGKIAAPKRR
jgi:hypothetical protein